MPRRRLLSPQEIIDAMKARGVETILATAPGSDLDEQLIWARAAMAAEDVPRMQVAHQYLEFLPDPLAIALCCAISAQLSQWGDVLMTELPKPRRGNARDAEAVAWIRLSRATARCGQERYGEAIAELGMGMQVAQEAGLDQFNQLLRGHIHWVETKAGIAPPEQVAKGLEEEMPSGRRWWWTSNYAVSLIGCGEYHEAEVAANPGTDFHRLALALQGKAVDDLRDDPFTRAAQTWVDAWHGRPVEQITGLYGQLLNTYARLALCLHLSRTPRGAHLAGRYVRATPPRQNDLAIIWGAVSLMIVGRGAYAPAPIHSAEVLVCSLNRLDRTDDVLALLSRLMPEVVVAMSVAPGAPVELALTAHLLLSRADRPSDKQIVAGFEGREVDASPNRPPNPGVVLHLIDRLISAAGDEQRDGLELTWRQARAQLIFEYGQNWGALGSSVDCTDGLGGSKVKA